jgi:hypothetical protein
MKKYYIRLAAQVDSSSIYTLAARYSSRLIDIREKSLYEDAVKRGLAYIVADYCNKVIGLCCIFEYGQESPYAEIGSLVVCGPMGFPFLEIILAAQIASFYKDRQEHRSLIANIETHRKGLKRRLVTNLGFRELMPSQFILNEHRKLAGNHSLEVEWLYMPRSAIAFSLNILHRQRISSICINARNDRVCIDISGLP